LNFICKGRFNEKAMEEVINLKQIKLLGGIGSILSFLVFIPHLGLWIRLAGFILISIAIFNLEKETKSRGIFAKFIFGSLISVAIVLLVFVFLLLGIGILAFMRAKGTALIIVVGGLLLVWLLFILGNYLIKKSYDGIAQITKEKNFARAGSFYFLGAITSIILVGFVLNFVARILEILAFFSLPDELKRE